MDLGFDCNAVDNSGRTPLHYAVEHSSEEIVQILLNRSAIITIRDSQDNLPLDSAKLSQISDCLLDQLGDINAKGMDGKTLLHFVCDADSSEPESAQRLLRKGANVSATDSMRRSPLFYASRSDFKEIRRILYENGASVLVVDKCSDTLLHLIEVTSDELEYYLKEGADINAANYFKETPLHFAAKHLNDDNIELLLSKEANSSVADRVGLTPLHYISSQRSRVGRMVNLLILSGAGVNATDIYGWTPLHYASNCDLFDELLLILIDNGACINAKNMGGKTPLHCACQFENYQQVMLLLEAGAFVNSLTIHGKTPLHFAYQYGSKDIVNILLKNGADPNLIDSDGNVPSYYSQ